VYSEKTPDDGQRNCPKHVEFYSKNKFEKLVHLVGFIIRTSLEVTTEREGITVHPATWLIVQQSTNTEHT
jgi:hypothetical protein